MRWSSPSQRPTPPKFIFKTRKDCRNTNLCTVSSAWSRQEAVICQKSLRINLYVVIRIAVAWRRYSRTHTCDRGKMFNEGEMSVQRSSRSPKLSHSLTSKRPRFPRRWGAKITCAYHSWKFGQKEGRKTFYPPLVLRRAARIEIYPEGTTPRGIT